MGAVLEWWLFSLHSSHERWFAGLKGQFPSGMANFSRVIRSKGLKLGLYTDRGTKTCAGRPGSFGFEQIDAVTYAGWNVSYLKEDNCGPNNVASAIKQFGMMRDALNRTGRRIFFSVCGGGDQLPWANLSWFATADGAGAALANSWRIAPDSTNWGSSVHAFTIDATLARSAKPGGWNDPDMLLSSSRPATRRLSPEQSRTQFSLWAILVSCLCTAHRSRWPPAGVR